MASSRVFALWASLVLRLLTLIWLLTILRLLLGLLTILGLVFTGLLALFLLCLVVLVRSPLRAISAQIFLSGLLRGLRTGGRLLGGRSLARQTPTLKSKSLSSQQSPVLRR